MHITGHCHCGEIAFEAEVDPEAMMICHCTDCQMLSGSAFRANIMAPAGTFKLVKGTPRTYVKTAESGSRRTQAFCGTCATQLYACNAVDPDRYSLRTGTIDQRAAFRPVKQIWRRSALAWVDSLEQVPASDRE